MSWTYDVKVKVKKRAILTSFVGAQMLSLSPGGVVTSPTDCVDATRTHLRTGIRAVGGTGSLQAEALVDGKSVRLATLNGARYASYGISEFVPLGTALGLAPGVSRSVQLRLTAVSGTWELDGVAIDPRSSR